MLKKLSIVLAAGAFMAVLTPAAHALTPAPLGIIAIDDVTTDIIQVAGGCGRGWHRDRWGRCVRNWGGPVWGAPRRVCRTVWRGGVRRTVCAYR
jgi:hypothetical protein